MMVIAIPTTDDIKLIDSCKSLGPNGFSYVFFTNPRGIIFLIIFAGLFRRFSPLLISLVTLTIF